MFSGVLLYCNFAMCWKCPGDALLFFATICGVTCATKPDQQIRWKQDSLENQNARFVPYLRLIRTLMVAKKARLRYSLQASKGRIFRMIWLLLSNASYPKNNPEAKWLNRGNVSICGRFMKRLSSTIAPPRAVKTPQVIKYCLGEAISLPSIQPSNLQLSPRSRFRRTKKMNWILSITSRHHMCWRIRWRNSCRDRNYIHPFWRTVIPLPACQAVWPL